MIRKSFFALAASLSLFGAARAGQAINLADAPPGVAMRVAYDNSLWVVSWYSHGQWVTHRPMPYEAAVITAQQYQACGIPYRVTRVR